MFTHAPIVTVMYPIDIQVNETTVVLVSVAMLMETLLNVVRQMHEGVLHNVILYVCLASLLPANSVLILFVLLKSPTQSLALCMLWLVLSAFSTILIWSRFLLFNYSGRRFHKFRQYIITKFSIRSIHCKSDTSTILFYFTWKTTIIEQSCTTVKVYDVWLRISNYFDWKIKYKKWFFILMK